MKPINTISKAVALTAGFASVALASEAPFSHGERARLDSIAQVVQDITSKAGISFSGSFEARALTSTVEAEEGASYVGQTREDVMSTTVDLSINARPHDALTATALVRMHQDWRNFFSASTTPLQTRWLSIDGNVNKMFFYNLGDYKARISPFTIWAPEPSILHEPEIYRRNRQDVMDEVFAGNNNRNLQGLKAAFRAQVLPAFDRLEVTLMGARLESSGKSVEHGPFSPSAIDADGNLMDKYLFTADLDADIMPGLSFGVTYLSSAHATATLLEKDAREKLKISSFSRRDVARQFKDDNSVIAARGSFGTALFDAINSDRLEVNLHAEFAMSNDTRWSVDTTETPDDDGVVKTFKSVENSVDANAIMVGGDLYAALGKAGSMRIDGQFLMVDSDFRNPLAQSPIFWKNAVMNTEAVPTSTADVDLMYNPFNALYRHVFKFAPSSLNAYQLAYDKQPMNKIAWTRATFSQEHLDSALAGFYPHVVDADGAFASPLLDPTFSPALPFGDATPNRLGIKGGGTMNLFDNALTLSGLLHFFQDKDEISVYNPEHERYDNLDKTDYLTLGAGTSVDAAKFGSWWSHPVIFSGSYQLSFIDGQQAMVGADSFEKRDFKTEIALLNAGFYFRFWERAALLGGMQQISDTYKVGYNSNDELKTVHSQLSLGLEFRVSEGGLIGLTFGSLKSEYENFRLNTKDEIKGKQVDLHMTVKF